MYKIIINGTNTYFVDTNGSSAIVNNFLYINGKKSTEGVYTYQTETENKVVTTDTNGMVISYA